MDKKSHIKLPNAVSKRLCVYIYIYTYIVLAANTCFNRRISFVKISPGQTFPDRSFLPPLPLPPTLPPVKVFHGQRRVLHTLSSVEQCSDFGLKVWGFHLLKQGK